MNPNGTVADGALPTSGGALGEVDGACVVALGALMVPCAELAGADGHTQIPRWEVMFEGGSVLSESGAAPVNGGVAGRSEGGITGICVITPGVLGMTLGCAPVVA